MYAQEGKTHPEVTVNLTQEDLPRLRDSSRQQHIQERCSPDYPCEYCSHGHG